MGEVIRGALFSQAADRGREGLRGLVIIVAAEAGTGQGTLGPH